jgi:hypothetical protein
VDFSVSICEILEQKYEKYVREKEGGSEGERERRESERERERERKKERETCKKSLGHGQCTGGHLRAKERGHRRNQTCQLLDLGLIVSRTMRK